MENEILINISNLNKSYFIADTRIDVLKELFLTVKAGESIAITGDSGIGKSTLLNIIGTIDKPDSGTYYFLDQNVPAMNDKALSLFRNKNIGFVFQAMYLLQEFTALENVLIPALISKTKKNVAYKMATDLLKEFNLRDRALHRPSELSGGERQRVAIARAIINRPKLILADEPTGNLDERNANSVADILSRLNREHNLAIIMVTHNNQLAKKMNMIYRLEDGKLKRVD